MNSLKTISKTRDQLDGYENVNLEEASGVQFLRENSQLIIADCLDLLEEMKEWNLVDLEFKAHVGEAQDLYSSLQILLDNVSKVSVDDVMVQEIEKTYNALMQRQEMIAQAYLDSVDVNDLAASANQDDYPIDTDIQLEESTLITKSPSETRVSKKLPIFGENGEVRIAINVRINNSDIIQSHMSTVPIVKSPDRLPSALISSLEKKDPINTSVYSPSLAARKKARAEMAEASWNKYVTKADLASILGKEYSTKAFTREFEAYTTYIEQESIDVFERWLGESRANVFDMLKDMTLQELDHFAADANLKSVLVANNIKYETFVRWFDEYKIINDLMKPKQSLLFGELVGHYVALQIAERVK